jgi:DNA-directed RNA polymerase specialized sigma24 family protein
VLNQPPGHSDSSKDQELVALVRQAGKDSGLMLSFESSLRELGVGTLLNLYKNKMLFKRLAMLQIFVDLPPPRDFRENVRALAYLAVYSCSRSFIDKYVFGDKWDPAKASLKTCFVNGSLVAFSREYRRFRSQETSHYGKELLKTEEDDDEPEVGRYYLQHPYPDPLQRFIEWEEIEDLLATHKDPIDNLIIRRTAQNFSQKEIGDELGLSEGAVSSRIRRARQKFKSERRVEG